MPYKDRERQREYQRVWQIARRTKPRLILDHGEGLKGKANCKCKLCLDKRNEYMRNYRRAKAGLRLLDGLGRFSTDVKAARGRHLD